MKNYSELIKSKNKRTLTAKGNSFVWRCLDIAAKQRNLHPYSKELKPLKEKFFNIMYFLILDQEKTIEEIKELIKNRNLLLS